MNLTTKKNWLEWIVFAVSLALVLSTLGYLIYDAATLGTASPSIEIQLGQSEPRSYNFALPVSVMNHGDEAAEDVYLEVVLETKEGKQERAELRFTLLPRRAKRAGWVAFTTDPRHAARVQARVLGYQKP